MLLLPNVPHLVIAYYGTLRIGAIAVMGNPLDTPAELVRQAEASGGGGFGDAGPIWRNGRSNQSANRGAARDLRQRKPIICR